MKRPKPNATTVMLSMPMIVSGITWGDMRFRREKRIPTRLKPVMLSCVTTWLVWRDDRVASRVVLMLLSVLFAFLFIVSIIDNFINNASLITPVMLRISLVHYFSHSPIDKRFLVFEVVSIIKILVGYRIGISLNLIAV